MKEVECILYGKVQGVFLRTFVKKRADELDVTGYVVNCKNGSVEVVAQGETDVLEDFVQHIKSGPTFARIDSVDVVWNDVNQDTFTDFTIEYDN